MGENLALSGVFLADGVEHLNYPQRPLSDLSTMGRMPLNPPWDEDPYTTFNDNLSILFAPPLPHRRPTFRHNLLAIDQTLSTIWSKNMKLEYFAEIETSHEPFTTDARLFCPPPLWVQPLSFLCLNLHLQALAPTPLQACRPAPSPPPRHH